MSDSERRSAGRPSWDDMGMATAELWALRSSDEKIRVGACLVHVHSRRVAGIGYNGRAAGEPNERESLAEGMSGYLHAEINCLLNANVREEPCVMYVTYEPCATCARAIVNSGRVARVVYRTPYFEEARRALGLPRGAEILASAGVVVERHEGPSLQELYAGLGARP